MTTARLPRGIAIVRRVIVVVLDGLRSDLISLLDLPVLNRLAGHGAATMHGRSVSPSVTAAAMTSLLTGVAPTLHGMTTDKFRIPRPRGTIDPLPTVLQHAGLRSTAWMARLPWTYRRLANAIVRRVGFERASFEGDDAFGVLEAAKAELDERRPGLTILHWPDADRAGHESGWPSPAYVRAVRGLDRCLGELDRFTGVSADPESLLIALADHGGGGRRRRFHDSTHPHDVTIPLVIAGGSVPPRQLAANSSLLDVPATVLRALGVAIPPSYQGTPLLAFADRRGRMEKMSWRSVDEHPLVAAV